MAPLQEGGHRLENGWTFTTKTGLYGTDYLQRAFVTAIGLGANRPQDAVYPTSEVDADGKPYSGANKYVMHFAKGQTPPVDGFWSITMYNADYFFVDNPLNKYTVSPRNDLKYNADGSLDIYIQNESPGKDKEANWLPAPKGKFILMMRLYWPQGERPLDHRRHLESPAGDGLRGRRRKRVARGWVGFRQLSVRRSQRRAAASESSGVGKAISPLRCAHSRCFA